MESGEGRTLCMLRRYSPSRFLWVPIKAAPGELRFDILDPTEKWKAQLVYTSISCIEGRGHSAWVITGGKADTPWGKASFLSGRSHKVVLGERELVTVTDHVSRCDFSFPGNQTISFKKHLGGSLEYIGETARLMISRETGKINPSIMQMGSKVDRSELESLPTMGSARVRTARRIAR